MASNTTAKPPTPYATVAEITRQQDRIARQVAEITARLTAAERAIRDAADRIEQMANGLSYPVNSIHLTRQQLHEIAAILRGVRHG